MDKIKVFISSVQSEFSSERKALVAYLRSDVLLGKFFSPFIFEELPSMDSSAQQVFMKEVAHSTVYLGLIGSKYGFKDSEGVSPTEREFDEALRLNKTKFIFLTSHQISEREVDTNRFIGKIETSLIRSKFSDISGLLQAVYQSLVRYLEEKQYIQHGPFDTRLCTQATLDDIDAKKVSGFIRLAQNRRGFPLPDHTPMTDVLHHLHLTSFGKLTNAALLLFGHEPQRFFPSAVVKCAVFHGETKTKPIPAYKIVTGDIFAMVDESIEFVLSRLNYSVGTRKETTAVSGQYELPREVVAEAIINALAHRDYTSHAGVEVILYQNRLEISNPGSLPMGWTTEHLRQLHNSVPHNPLLAHPLYLAGYIEQLGTGTEDMIKKLKENGLPDPLFIQDIGFRVELFRSVAHDTPQDTPQVTPQVELLIKVIKGDESREELQEKVNIKDREYFRKSFINEALNQGFIELTIPDKPTSKNQKYRLSQKGRTLKKKLK